MVASRTLPSSAACSQGNEEEVIRLASEEDSNKTVYPTFKIDHTLPSNAEFFDEPVYEINQQISICMNDATEIMNGVSEPEVNFDEFLESPLPFINQPRFQYHSKSNADFEHYLDWIVSNSLPYSF